MSLADRMHVGRCLNEMEERSNDCSCKNPDCFSSELQMGLVEIVCCVLNNCCIYYSYFQKVPAEAPQLELKANYGLVEPVPFEFPALNAHWTPETLAAFDLTKRPKDDTVR